MLEFKKFPNKDDIITHLRQYPTTKELDQNVIAAAAVKFAGLSVPNIEGAVRLPLHHLVEIQEISEQDVSILDLALQELLKKS